MDEELVERLRALMGRVPADATAAQGRLPATASIADARIGPDERPETLEHQRALSAHYLRSPLADTLNALSGAGRPTPAAPSRVGQLAERVVRGGKVAGTYTPVGDRVAAGDRQTVIHEYGHRRQFRTPQGLKALLNPTFVVPQDNAQAAAYTKANRAEAYATAFTSAFNLLDRIQQFPRLQDPEQLQRVLEVEEARAPGTRKILYELLEHPVYANHVLRSRESRPR